MGRKVMREVGVGVGVGNGCRREDYRLDRE